MPRAGPPKPPHPGSNDLPVEFYHGTSLQKAISIQQSGFRVDLAGTNAGAMLGDGVYITSTLEKAMNYAKPNPHAGVIFQLRVHLGKCKQVVRGDPLMRTWYLHGYDSAWSPAGVNGEREENCVRDPGRITITNVIFGDTVKAKRNGYQIRAGKLERLQSPYTSSSTPLIPHAAHKSTQGTANVPQTSTGHIPYRVKPHVRCRNFCYRHSQAACMWCRACMQGARTQCRGACRGHLSTILCAIPFAAVYVFVIVGTSIGCDHPVLEVFGAGSSKANGQYYDAYDSEDGKPKYRKVGTGSFFGTGSNDYDIEYYERVDGGKWRLRVRGGTAYAVYTAGTEAKPPSTGWRCDSGTSPPPRLKWLDDADGYDKNFVMCGWLCDNMTMGTWLLFTTFFVGCPLLYVTCAQHVCR
jgi:hypothetical protein